MIFELGTELKMIKRWEQTLVRLVQEIQPIKL